MDFTFDKKVVYILSPERWGVMRISKHHYALELAERGSEVYFIEPPSLSNKAVEVKVSDEHPRLHIVKYKPVFRGERFLPAILFNILLRWQIRLIKNAIGKKPDVLWCFEPYRFLNLQWFKSKVSLFFAADLFPRKYLPPEVFTSDFNLGISDSIVKKLQSSNKPVYFVNHGLSKYFADQAQRRMELPPAVRMSKVIKAGYIGNLLMEALDRVSMRKVIEVNKDVVFEFWGQFQSKGNLPVFNDPSVTEFVEFLKSQPHVKLNGPLHPQELSRQMAEMDLFWICWQLNRSKLWDGSNSHKMLEYLSTGKPVVSHYMSTYSDSKLVDMLPTTDNSEYASLFKQVVDRIRNTESEALQQSRIQFALDNTYTKHISFIEGLIGRCKS